MKAFSLVVGIGLIVGMAGCGGSVEDTASKTVMPDVEGRQLDVALSDIKRVGFEDKVDVSGGGTFGIVDESKWKVCDQAPAAGQALKGAPRLTVDRSCGDSATEATTPPTTAPPAPSEPKPKPKAEEILTAASNRDLAAVLAQPNNCSDTIERFATMYRNRTIEFDGNIATMNKHGSYTTRFDILVSPGKFSKTSALGPTFQFRDVAYSDLHLAGPNIPDYVVQGLNLHFTARIEDYESSSCLFLLDPISTKAR